MSNPLEGLSRRVENDPFFLASLLARYARAEGLDDASLADTLGCPADVLPALRLCRAPRAEPAEFREDVRRVAERFGLEALRLARVVRHAQSLEHLAAGPGAAHGMLMAARDSEGGKPGGEGPAPAGGKS